MKQDKQSMNHFVFHFLGTRIESESSCIKVLCLLIGIFGKTPKMVHRNRINY